MAWTVVASAPFARRSWRELLYALVAFPLGLAGFVFVVASLFIGIYLSIALVGVALLALSSLGARQLGALNRALARRFLDEEVAPPPPFRPRPGVVGWVRSGLADRPGWRARAYLVLKLPVALASFVAVMALRLGSLWLVLAPAQWAANVGADTVQDHGIARHYVINFGSFYFDTWPRTLLLTAIGLAGWWLAPWVLRALLYLDRRLLADLLGPSSLPSRVRQLERARAGAVDDAAARLRRLERDLHDGAQAARKGGGRKRPATGWASLTPAELEVARLVSEGLRNDAIARRLFITPGTVKVHLTHIFAKLSITTRAELAAQAAAQDPTAR